MHGKVANNSFESATEIRHHYPIKSKEEQSDPEAQVTNPLWELSHQKLIHEKEVASTIGWTNRDNYRGINKHSPPPKKKKS